MFVGSKALAAQHNGFLEQIVKYYLMRRFILFLYTVLLEVSWDFFFFLKNSWCKWEIELMVEEITLALEWVVFLIFAL